MRRRLFIFVIMTGVLALWWLVRHPRLAHPPLDGRPSSDEGRRRQTTIPLPSTSIPFGPQLPPSVGNKHITVGQSLTLQADSNDLKLELNSPHGETRLRGTLGSGGVYIGGTFKPCPIAGIQQTGGCAEWMPSIADDKDRLKLEVAYSRDLDCYTVKWRIQATTRNIAVVDCFMLADALWYGGPQVYHQRWPINSQMSAMQPHVTGDYLVPQWRDNRTYGRYGSLVEPYWLSSAGVSITVLDDRITLSSSFNAHNDGKLCLKGSHSSETNGIDVPEILSYTICHRKDIATVHQTMSRQFFPSPNGYPDVRMMRKPIWSTWAQYKEKVNQSNVVQMAKGILRYNFSHRYASSLLRFLMGSVWLYLVVLS